MSYLLARPRKLDSIFSFGIEDGMSKQCRWLCLSGLMWALGAGNPVQGGPLKDAQSYQAAISKINEAHVKQPGKIKEEELRRRLPTIAISALQKVLKTREDPELSGALVMCGEAALDLDLMDHFQQVSDRLAAVDATASAKLGSAVSKSRLIVRGIGSYEPGYLEQFAVVCEGILEAYDRVFGFAEYSKVPGKKLRFRVHVVPAITQPPHFAPQFPWHSEIDFPVVDNTRFTSPTPQGQFLFYGLCHEIGHVIAMWGDLKNMEDKHAWAHYTGTAIVEYLSERTETLDWMKDLRDARWRSLKLERELPANKAVPSTASYASMMALLIALHDSIGPQKIGMALNQMDESKQCRRVNQVRYYSMADFGKMLIRVSPDRKQEIAELFRLK
jgi:hypothetical protein